MGSTSFLIDVGSSTVKVYRYSNSVLSLEKAKSISFKDGFTPEVGITQENKDALIEFLKSVQRDHPDSDFYIYATAIFRKYTQSTLEDLQKEVLGKTGISFKIITQDEENEYLEHALIDKFQTGEPLLLLNIGGGSTEITVVQDGKVIERKNIDLGVGSVLSEFPDLNNSLPRTKLAEVLTFSKTKLPKLDSKPKIAFYSGGELMYMQLAGYNLAKNILFNDPDHPSVITLQDFQRRNEEIFTQVTQEELERLMPEYPGWMKGARACSGFAQSIFEKYGIEIIIPSNSNLINGVIRKDFS